MPRLPCIKCSALKWQSDSRQVNKSQRHWIVYKWLWWRSCWRRLSSSWIFLTRDRFMYRSYLYNLLQVHRPSRALRFSTPKLLQVPFLSTDFGCRAFNYSSPATWNLIPTSIKIVSTSINNARLCARYKFSSSPYYYYGCIILLEVPVLTFGLHRVPYALCYCERNFEQYRATNSLLN